MINQFPNSNNYKMASTSFACLLFIQTIDETYKTFVLLDNIH